MYDDIYKKLILLTKKALDKDEVPIGCVITKNKQIISSAYNQKITKKNPMAHAEILAIKKACKKIGSWNLKDCELYVTLRPCNMCLAVISESRIKKVYYIVDNNKNVNNKMLITKTNFNKHDEYFSDILTSFFKNKR